MGLKIQLEACVMMRFLETMEKNIEPRPGPHLGYIRRPLSSSAFALGAEWEAAAAQAPKSTHAGKGERLVHKRSQSSQTPS